MLIRCCDGKIIDIKIQSFITDKDYYDILLKATKYNENVRSVHKT